MSNALLHACYHDLPSDVLCVCVCVCFGGGRVVCAAGIAPACHGVHTGRCMEQQCSCVFMLSVAAYHTLQ